MQLVYNHVAKIIEMSFEIWSFMFNINDVILECAVKGYCGVWGKCYLKALMFLII